MILEVKMIKESDDVYMDLPNTKHYIKDTISNWIIVNSLDLTIAVFDKFSTVSIVLKDNK